MDSSIKLMTPEQTVKFLVIKYPTIYAVSDKDTAKLHIFDTLFNTIGTEYSDIDGFIENLSFSQEKKNIFNHDISRLFQEKNVNLCYSGTINSYGIDFNDPDTFLGIFNDTEKSNMENISYYTPSLDKEFVPYPSFNKNLSLFWKEDMSWLSKEWLETSKWFFQECKEFFNSDNVFNYHYYYPKDSNKIKWKSLISGYTKKLNAYEEKSNTTEEYHRLVSEAYGVEFDGDIVKLIKSRGNHNVNQAISFIDETIEKIDGLIKNKPKNNKKLKI